MSKRIVTGLDIGTTKVVAIVARVASAHGPEVIGMGTARSAGLWKAEIVDMAATVDAVNEAVREAERSAGVPVPRAFVGVTGAHVTCEASSGATAVGGHGIGQEDVGRVHEAASNLYVPLNREVLHVEPTEYVVDGQRGIRKPVGMAGRRMEAMVRVVTGAESAISNTIACCQRAGVDVTDVVFSGLASARSVLRASERRSGVAVVDVGGGCTDLCIYRSDALVHAAALPVGGNHFTNDIALGLRLSHDEAERIKRQYAVASERDDRAGFLDLTTADGAQACTSWRSLNQIVRPRAEELFELLAGRIHEELGSVAGASVVITGGGAILEGLDLTARRVLGMPVRLGVPDNGKSLVMREALGSPTNATAIGLMLYASDEAHADETGGLLEPFMERLKGWTKGFSSTFTISGKRA